MFQIIIVALLLTLPTLAPAKATPAPLAETNTLSIPERSTSRII